MGSIEARGHAFVIRIWLERAGQEATWRGHITHVVTEKRHHFVELTEILPFIRTYLESSAAGGERPRPSNRRG